MNRDEVLYQLKTGKAVHSGWLQKAKQIIDGFTINETSTPVASTECAFGLWFYTEGQRLCKLRNNSPQSMKSVETLHYNIHEIYQDIYYIYYGGKSKGFFSSKFGKRKVKEKDIELAKSHYKLMKEATDELIGEFTRMERRIAVISATEIESI
ncbi:MAG: CZB domain-containing protein [Sulfurovum sp.]